jgi:hypothetical protein
MKLVNLGGLTIGVLLAVVCLGCSGGSGAGNGESVARDAVAAMISGDLSKFNEHVVPGTEAGGIDAGFENRPDLSGCDAGDATVLFENLPASNGQARVVFSHPCGSDPSGQPITSCLANLDRLSGSWYVTDVFC